MNDILTNLLSKYDTVEEDDIIDFVICNALDIKYKNKYNHQETMNQEAIAI